MQVILRIYETHREPPNAKGRQYMAHNGIQALINDL